MTMDILFTQDQFPQPPKSWNVEPGGLNFVPGVGKRNAPIMIIGEAPGSRENISREPFVGPAGNVLNGLLSRAGLSREECYITNVVKYRPPDNDITIASASEQVQKNIPMLLQEIKTVNPRVIVPTGNTALRALGFGFKIHKARGSISQMGNAKVIPTLHPAALFRQWHEIFTVQKDWQKIARHAKNPGIPQFREDFNITPTIEDLEDFALFVNNLANSGAQVQLGIDIETYKADHPMDTPLKTIGFANSMTQAIVVPFINQSHQYYWKTKGQALRAIKAIGSILENPRIEKIFHNGLFDILVLMNHGFTVEGPFFDTMLAQYLVYHLSPHDLGYVVSIYTDYPPWKLTEGSGDTEFRTYNARDCVVLKIIYDELKKDVEDNGIIAVFNALMQQILPTVKMMLNGIHLDSTRYTMVKDMLEEQLEEVRKKIADIAQVADFNPESTRHMSNLLFKKLKLRSNVRTKGGSKSTGSDVLNRLSLRYPDLEVINDIINYRTLSTRYKTFIKGVRVHGDGRVHSSFQMHTAVTGRFSSRNPNLQNLPSRTDSSGYIRKMYTPEHGNKIVTADFSQAELIVFAVIAQDEIWLEAFENGVDIHVVNAEALLGFYDKKYRTFVKNFIYGLIYGSEGGEIEKVAPKELIQKISIREMLNNLKKTHPALFYYREKIEQQLKDLNYVTNVFGRKRWFVNKVSKEDLRSAYNFPIQSTVGDLMHLKMAELDKALEWPTDKLILQLHDAFYVETPESRVDSVARMLQGIMQAPIYSPSGYEFNLKVDVEVGDSLSSKEMKAWSEERDKQ